MLYECFPMAMLVEQAGGKAITGTQRSLETMPDSIHDRCGWGHSCVGLARVSPCLHTCPEISIPSVALRVRPPAGLPSTWAARRKSSL